MGWEGRSRGLWDGRSRGLCEGRSVGLRDDWRDCETRCVRCQSSSAFSHLLGVGAGLRVRVQARVRAGVVGLGLGFGGCLPPHEDNLTVEIIEVEARRTLQVHRVLIHVQVQVIEVCECCTVRVPASHQQACACTLTTIHLAPRGRAYAYTYVYSMCVHVHVAACQHDVSPTLRSSVLGSKASPDLLASKSSSKPLPPLPPSLRGTLRAALHAPAWFG